MLLNTTLVASQIHSYISECLNSCEYWAKEMQIAASISMIFLLRWFVHLLFYTLSPIQLLEPFLLNSYHNLCITILFLV